MEQSIMVTLNTGDMNAVDELSKQDGVSPNEVVHRAVMQHLFLRQFRSLRERMSANAEQQGIFTDQDVFDRVS